jgi:hypothetical protein
MPFAPGKSRTTRRAFIDFPWMNSSSHLSEDCFDCLGSLPPVAAPRFELITIWLFASFYSTCSG